MGDQHELLSFGTCFVGLRHVHVHFVTVEIGVVRGGGCQVEAEGGVRQNFYSMALGDGEMRGTLRQQIDGKHFSLLLQPTEGHFH